MMDADFRLQVSHLEHTSRREVLIIVYANARRIAPPLLSVQHREFSR